MTKLIFNILIAGSFIAGVYLPGKKISNHPAQPLLNPTEKRTHGDTITLSANPESNTKNRSNIQKLVKECTVDS